MPWSVWTGRPIRPVPEFRTTGPPGSASPAEVANSIDQLRQRLMKREPEHIVVVSSDEAGYAMPAAAWAARSGDPVLQSPSVNVPAVSETVVAVSR